jgi:hypothetical protein
VIKVSYEYDQDPRYGWASIDVTESRNPLIIVYTTKGSRGYTVNTKGFLVPTCICSATTRGECGCVGV